MDPDDHSVNTCMHACVHTVAGQKLIRDWIWRRNFLKMALFMLI